MGHGNCHRGVQGRVFKRCGKSWTDVVDVGSDREGAEPNRWPPNRGAAALAVAVGDRTTTRMAGT